MLLIEKVIKLLDEFHFKIYREHVKNLSIRSYYPLALIDVIDRGIMIEQDSKVLFKNTYGEVAKDEKDFKKFFQLGCHTIFKLGSSGRRN